MDCDPKRDKKKTKKKKKNTKKKNKGQKTTKHHDEQFQSKYELKIRLPKLAFIGRLNEYPLSNPSQ